MTQTPEDDRFEPPYEGDELAIVAGFLDFHRDTLLWKCAGLTPEQLRLRPLSFANLSLHGLVRHLADVERFWFRESMAGEDIRPIYWSEENPDLDIDPPADADPLADIEVFKAELALVRETVRGRSLDDTFVSRRGNTLNVRWVYVHMVEEYARHNGHADLLRQAIDGVVGE
jgi:hypothetical protein